LNISWVGWHLHHLVRDFFPKIYHHPVGEIGENGYLSPLALLMRAKLFHVLLRVYVKTLFYLTLSSKKIPDGVKTTKIPLPKNQTANKPTAYFRILFQLPNNISRKHNNTRTKASGKYQEIYVDMIMAKSKKIFT
jgi:hypothetical protein